MQYGEFRPGLTYSIQYRPLSSDPASFKEIRLQREPFSLAGSAEFKDLIPYTEYEFKIRCRSPDSDSDLMWSPDLTISTRTLPDVPYRRPEITNSSFTIESNYVTESFPDMRTITLYWKGVPAAHENGPDFHYVIHVSSRNLPLGVIAVGNETKYSFWNMTVNTRYKFQLYASNSVGLSTNISGIVVATDKLLRGPKDIIVEAKENSYFISWTSEYEVNYYENEIEYYTLFWCKSSIPRPVICHDSLQWLHLNQTEYNLQLTGGNDYQFAVSANSLKWTSGMFWASCHISFNPQYFEAYEICLNFTQALATVPDSGILYL
ncbi:cytokine receptor-like isoform X2 [Stegodyphus dumicola]|uniref:cytokine receptor-like isoform X2 n=1 Tax=Stegodyphus dumicola TaxID=202533 RepID=UPI0015A7DC78|nr:cytokine receptor-like isoform X2 [Stegodyphus dumicola]